MDQALADRLLELCDLEQKGLVELQRDPQLNAELEAVGRSGRRASPPGASFVLLGLTELALRSSTPALVHELVAVRTHLGWYLERLVLAHGWPGVELVGEEAAVAFSAMLAHADDRPSLRRQAIEAALGGNGQLQPDIDGRQYGHVVDRTQVILEAPQVYGTYLLPKPGGPGLVWPVQDEAQLDARRERIRLPPIQHDIDLYKAGATPGPFLVPVAPGTGWTDVPRAGQERSRRVVRVSREVAASPERIFELIADPANQPRWDGNDNLKEAAPGQRVRAIGDVFTMTLTMGSIRENHVVEFVEGRRIAWQPAEMGKAPPGHTWAWELEPLGPLLTLVTHTYDWTDLTDPKRLAAAQATTPDRLGASLARLAALAEDA